MRAAPTSCACWLCYRKPKASLQGAGSVTRGLLGEARWGQVRAAIFCQAWARVGAKRSCIRKNCYYVQYVMALPAHLLERLPARVRRGEPSSSDGSAGVLSLGSLELDALLPDGGLLRGSVVELSVTGGLGLATSLSLAACRSAQDEASSHGGAVPWCAFIDPSGTLYGPGVASTGVELERLLVVRPRLDALERTAIRLAESQVFSVIVIDAMGVPGASLDVGLGAWPRVVRRLALGVAGSGSCVILVTDGEARRPLPLPVAMRLEIARSAEDRLSVRIGKERRGRVSGPRSVVWVKPRAKPLRPRPPFEPHGGGKRVSA
jgi:hypothetical protein